MQHIRGAQVGLARGDLAFPVGVGALAVLVTIAQLALVSRIAGRVFLAHASLRQVGGLLALLLGAIAVRAWLVWLREVTGQRAAIRSKATLRARLFTHLLALGPAALRRERTGELVATTNEGIERIDPYISRYLPQRVLSVLAPLLIAGAVLTQDWVSGVVLLVTAPVIPLLMLLVGSYAESHVQGQWTALARMNAHMLDALQGLPTLKLFGRDGAEGTALARISRDYRDRTLGSLRFAFLSSLVLEFITAGAIALVAVTLGVRLLAGGISFERALFILLLTPEFYRPLRELGTYRHAAMEGGAAAARVTEILSRPAPARSPAGGSALPGGPLTISFSGVRYSYPGSTAPALRGLDLVLPSGARTALVGRSGSGKSTLVNLLLRYLEADEGQILVNGLPLDQIPVALWRAHLAFVPQRPHLFAGTLHDNIGLGRPRATRREIAWAAELSGAAAFIEQLPRGYETPIGERGARLSGGEAQRIAIARAFLQDAPVLILDEPTSCLDPVSETLIRSALSRLMHDRTVLIVAHRLNTVYMAEQIAVLDGGRVVELGRHAELLAHGGAYARLVRAGREAPV